MMALANITSTISTSLLVVLLLLFPPPLTCLNSDGVLLLSFRYSLTDDPLSALRDWNYDDQTPCSWNGITCADITTPHDDHGFQYLSTSRVISLDLPNKNLSGTLSADIGCLQHLRHLDLSHNSFNGTLPPTLFNASGLHSLDLSGNHFSGEVPKLAAEDLNPKPLQFLNLSFNALTGTIPDNLTVSNLLPNLTVVSLSNNYLFGDLPNRLDSIEILDLSRNLFNGSLPGGDLSGSHLHSLNLSYNRLSGEISPRFASSIPSNATLDLSFNNLTGQVPDSLFHHEPKAFAGNPNLCGAILPSKPCYTPSTPPSTPTSPPVALAAIPKAGNHHGGPSQGEQGGLKPKAIVGIVVGDVVGIAILLSVVVLYVYRLKNVKVKEVGRKRGIKAAPSVLCPCFGKKERWKEEEMPSSLPSDVGSEEEEDDDQEESSSSTSTKKTRKKGSEGKVVMVDGETELESETLLRATAYAVGASSWSIVYRTVVEDGRVFAVRRLGESGVSTARQFHKQVRSIAKMTHPNLVRLRGYYWGQQEKLLIYDYVPNGSLAASTATASISKRTGASSPRHLSWNQRLTIARGVARALAYLHTRKCVHGNLKPSNILLGPDMEPRIADLGLEKLLPAAHNTKSPIDSVRHFGSKRSTPSRDELPSGSNPILYTGCASPYHAPESLKTVKPNPEWDVYSFGMVLLELVLGRVLSKAELSEWTQTQVGSTVEEKQRMLRMADVAILSGVQGREEALLACFRLGFACASALPNDRPCIKDALQTLDRISLN